VFRVFYLIGTVDTKNLNFFDLHKKYNGLSTLVFNP